MEYEEGYYFYYIPQNKPKDHFYYWMARYLPFLFNIKVCNMIEVPYISMAGSSILLFADKVEKEDHLRLERWISDEKDLKGLELEKGKLLENILKCMTIKEKQVQLDRAIFMIKDAVPKSQIVRDNVQILKIVNEALGEKLTAKGKEVGVYERTTTSPEKDKGESEKAEGPTQEEEQTV